MCQFIIDNDNLSILNYCLLNYADDLHLRNSCFLFSAAALTNPLKYVSIKTATNNETNHAIHILATTLELTEYVVSSTVLSLSSDDVSSQSLINISINVYAIYTGVQYTQAM